MRRFSLLCCLLLFFFAACEQVTEQPEDTVPETRKKQAAAENDSKTTDLSPPDDPAAVPVSPPIFDDFEGQPQLSLFPRVGDYSPEVGSNQRPFWQTFIEHLSRTSGVTDISGKTQVNKVWSFHSINSINSVGFFSPIAVQPNTSYKVDFLIKCTLPEEASAGIGILEFDQFLWIADQYPESLLKKHLLGGREGVRLKGAVDWQPQSFTFTTGPQVRMIHLVLFREGTHDRTPVLMDEIRIDLAAR